jgi:hypothetical protein
MRDMYLKDTKRAHGASRAGRFAGRDARAPRNDRLPGIHSIADFGFACWMMVEERTCAFLHPFGCV